MKEEEGEGLIRAAETREGLATLMNASAHPEL
jgi:hypothetical protein